MDRRSIGTAAALTLLLVVAVPTTSRSELLVTQGIGLQSCARLGPSLKPGAGLDHLPNALLF